MIIHEVKIYKEYADSVLNGEKPFEIRYNDRGYQKGDILKFRVVERYTNLRSYHKLDDKQYLITYVHSGLGMKDDYVVLGIKKVIQNEKIK